MVGAGLNLGGLVGVGLAGGEGVGGLPQLLEGRRNGVGQGGGGELSLPLLSVALAQFYLHVALVPSLVVRPGAKFVELMLHSRRASSLFVTLILCLLYF